MEGTITYYIFLLEHIISIIPNVTISMVPKRLVLGKNLNKQYVMSATRGLLIKSIRKKVKNM